MDGGGHQSNRRYTHPPIDNPHHPWKSRRIVPRPCLLVFCCVVGQHYILLPPINDSWKWPVVFSLSLSLRIRNGQCHGQYLRYISTIFVWISNENGQWQRVTIPEQTEYLLLLLFWRPPSMIQLPKTSCIVRLELAARDQRSQSLLLFLLHHHQ